MSSPNAVITNEMMTDSRLPIRLPLKKEDPVLKGNVDDLQENHHDRC